MAHRRLTRGYVQVYTGHGKGKTTAALGLVLRAAGHGLRSHVIQFMKGDIEYGEITAVRHLGGLVTITQMGRPTFVDKAHPDPEDIRLANEALQLAHTSVRSGEFDIVVLDEVNVALDYGLIPVAKVLELVATKPPHVELILTGRNAPQAIIDVADLVTEMHCIRHYYERGVAARRGIEF
ncbi:MAG: cob(I)yrinic acid a,c-diamide adenosyltransferase [candidate division KSB1 bacterium]|nr:cob(I)yrinic acid a,c-diamide adenosyltransferase [candidate division KSB1 bacterium]